MKTAGRGNPNRWARVSSNRPDGVARLKQILLIHGGWEVTKIPVIGEVFFLDFPFYRTFFGASCQPCHKRESQSMPLQCGFEHNFGMFGSRSTANASSLCCAWPGMRGR